jgi:flagellar protein FlbD
MIQLTRLNTQPLVVNSDLIKFVERAPDTVLTLLNGEKILVSESVEIVVQKIIEFRKSILAGSAVNSATASPANAIVLGNASEKLQGS